MLALELIDRVRTVSPATANRLISAVLPVIIPSSGGLGIRADEVTDTRTVTFLPLKKRTRNHVGSVYFGAQMTLAELTMGIHMFRIFPPGPYGMLVNRVEADFRSKGKTGLKGVFEPDPAEIQRLKDVLAGPEARGTAWMTVNLLDTEDKPVTDVKFLVALRRFKESPTGTRP